MPADDLVLSGEAEDGDGTATNPTTNVVRAANEQIRELRCLCLIVWPLRPLRA
jgi:hypothetical protein